MSDVICSYTKEDAVADGQQFKIGKEAVEAGFKVPVYMTAGVQSLVNVPKELEGYQDYEGRLWDVLFMASLVVKAELKKEVPEYLLAFNVCFLMPVPENEPDIKEYTLWIAFHPNEGFTIMRPEEY
jgi:hypothetical protein